jgi:hypothetical protein
MQQGQEQQEEQEPRHVLVDASDLAVLLSAGLTAIVHQPGDSPSRELLARACRNVCDALLLTRDDREALLKATSASA